MARLSGRLDVDDLSVASVEDPDSSNLRIFKTGRRLIGRCPPRPFGREQIPVNVSQQLNWIRAFIGLRQFARNGVLRRVAKPAKRIDIDHRSDELTASNDDGLECWQEALIQAECLADETIREGQQFRKERVEVRASFRYPMSLPKRK